MQTMCIQVTKVDTNYNDIRLRQEHPELAKAFEKVLLNNREIGNRFRPLYYSGHYETAKRPGKKISLSRIILLVEEAGYEVSIKIHGSQKEITTKEIEQTT